MDGDDMDGIEDGGALRRAQRAGQRAASRGFDWPGVEGALAKLKEEVLELESLLGADDDSPKRRAEELGDILFSAVNVARHLRCDAESVLDDATDKFEGRWQIVQDLARDEGDDPEEMTIDELESLWQRAKARST